MDKIFKHVQVLGMAAAVSKHRQKVMDLDFDKRTMARIIKLTGIKELSVSPDGITGSDYCVAAAEKLFAELDFDRSKIDGIVYATPHPDYVLPGTCGVIQQRLKLRREMIATDINQGCTGFIYSLFIAYLWVESGYCKNVLVCTGDSSARHSNEHDKSMKMVMGDGGTAVIVTKATSETKATFSFVHDGYKVKDLYIPAGGERMPLQKGVTDVEEIDDEGNVRTLADQYMNGMALMQFSRDESRVVVDDVLKRMNMRISDITMLALHQPNEFMVKAIAKQFDVPLEKVPMEVSETGNIGGGAMGLALCKSVEKRNIYSMQNSLLCAFGTGLSCAAMVVDFSRVMFCHVQEI